MRNFISVVLGSLLLLTPTFAVAQTGSGLPPQKPRPAIASSTASSTFPKLGPAIKQAIDKARAVGSSTQERVEAVKQLITRHRDDIRAMIQQKRNDMQEKIAEAKQKAAEKYGDAVQRSVGNIVDKLNTAVERLTSVADRVEQRIADFAAAGVDTSNVQSLLDTAHDNITTAQTAVSTVGSTLSMALASTSPKGEMSKVRDSVKAAEEAIQTARVSLQAAFDATKALSTSTPQQ